MSELTKKGHAAGGRNVLSRPPSGAARGTIISVAVAS